MQYRWLLNGSSKRVPLGKVEVNFLKERNREGGGEGKKRKERRKKGREESKRKGQEKKGHGRNKELSCEYNRTHHLHLSSKHLEQTDLNVEDLPVNTRIPHKDRGTNCIAPYFTKLPHITIIDDELPRIVPVYVLVLIIDQH